MLHRLPTLLALAAAAEAATFLPGAPEYLASIAGNGDVCTLRCPDEVVLPTTVDEVAAAVLRARRANSSVAVRGGGHSTWCQWARGEGTLIDLRPMWRAVVDAEPSPGGDVVVRVGGGATAYEVLPALRKQGLQVLHGMVPNVGIGGVTLGGGYHIELTPLRGWAVDSILGFTLVTPSGSVVHVNATGTDVVAASPLEPDPAALAAGNWLWWAVKGTWSSFGAVVEFELVGHPYPAETMYSVPLLALSLEKSLDVVTRPPPGWSCSYVGATYKPQIRALAPALRALGVEAGAGNLMCVKLDPAAVPATAGALMKQYNISHPSPAVPVPLSVWEAAMPCEGRHGGKIEGLGLIIGTEDLAAAMGVLREMMASTAVGIIGGGGRFELRSETAMGWPKKPVFVAFSGASGDNLISYLNGKLPEWRKTVGARIYPNWGECSLEDFGHVYYGDNYEALLSYKQAIDPTNVFQGVQNIGNGDTKCWASGGGPLSANCQKAGASQAAFNKAWGAVVQNCKDKVPFPVPCATLDRYHCGAGGQCVAACEGHSTLDKCELECNTTSPGDTV